MFDKALSSLLTAAILCASAALAIFAAGFALYALVLPQLGAAGAAALVAGAAAVLVGLVGLMQLWRTKARDRERAAAQAEFSSAIPEPLRDFMRRHPLGAIAVTLVGGIVAARNPRVVRELVAAFRARPD